MANVTHNPINTSKFFKGNNVNKREKSVSQSSYSVIVADTSFSLTSTDGIDAVRATATLTATLPNAAENKGRCICFINQDLADTLTIAQNADGANIDGAASNLTITGADDEWVELYCTGTEWIILKGNLA